MTCGSQRRTTAGVVGTSGTAIRCFGYTMRSSAAGVGTVTLYDGTSTSGTEKWLGTGTQDGSADKVFGAKGKYFPNGLYADFDGNVTYVDFDYVQETA
mgnify:CR=1 FL=1